MQSVQFNTSFWVIFEHKFIDPMNFISSMFAFSCWRMISADSSFIGLNWFMFFRTNFTTNIKYGGKHEKQLLRIKVQSFFKKSLSDWLHDVCFGLWYEYYSSEKNPAKKLLETEIQLNDTFCLEKSWKTIKAIKSAYESKKIIFR